ncbi:hypothetical protein DO72_4432 [Burkholderia pseudomallei]|nr:hypothetical protein DO72_4432 [Burkholderia pseudomallei]
MRGSAEPAPLPFAAPASAAAAVPCSEPRFAASSASICFGSTRVIRCWYARIGCSGDSGVPASAHVSGAMPRNASTPCATRGSTGLSASDSRRNASRLTLQVSCSATAFAGSFASSHGFAEST